MTKREIYKIWAPLGKKWVDWARPVPFLEISNKTSVYKPMGVLLPHLEQLNAEDTTTAIIVDLPGATSVEVGIELAKRGYRPIPIYNGVAEQNGSRATTDNHSIVPALVWGASVLSKIELSDNARPAFLTDTHRLQRWKIDCSVFDNSWDVYPQDLPSEKYLIDSGISKILVVGNDLSRDLRAIFAEYTQKKIQIFWTDGYSEPKLIKRRQLFLNRRIKRDFD